MTSDPLNDETKNKPSRSRTFDYFLVAVNVIYGLIGAFEAWFERDHPRRFTVGLIMACLGLITVLVLLSPWRKR